MARSATTPYAVLGMLTLRPMTGYDLREEIAHSIGHFWTESFGQLYPTLRDLAGRGLVRGRAAGPRRRVEYALTDTGRESLRRWLAEDAGPYSSQRNELLLKLFFGRHADPGVMASHLDRHREQLRAALVQYRAIEAALRAEASADAPYWLLTVQHGITVTEAGLAWAAQTAAVLEGTDPADPDGAGTAHPGPGSNP